MVSRTSSIGFSLFAMKRQHSELDGQLPRTLRPTIIYIVVRGNTYSERDNGQSANRHSETGAIYTSGVLFLSTRGGQRSHDEGNETRAPKAAKTRFGIVRDRAGCSPQWML